ncbi:hypothetical protein [Paenibacillus sp. NRS-1780]|uniref:hypothetical protein n=1 Tax=Paenibacillus sp. NRS-1780 TaxID=3233904 RepID=UPI003D2C4D6D
MTVETAPMWEWKLLELLTSFPKLPDSDFEGKYQHLNFRWAESDSSTDQLMEAALLAVKRHAPREDFKCFAAQVIYRAFARDVDPEVQLLNFLEAAFGFEELE